MIVAKEIRVLVWRKKANATRLVTAFVTAFRWHRDMKALALYRHLRGTLSPPFCSCSSTSVAEATSRMSRYAITSSAPRLNYSALCHDRPRGPTSRITEEIPPELTKPSTLCETLSICNNDAGANYLSGICLQAPLIKGMFAIVKPWKF